MIDRFGYKAYLDSPEWAKIRKARLQHDGYRCTGCGDDGSQARLEVHHLTYERLGRERLTDLVTLCNLCHAREHGHAPLQGPIAGPTSAELDQRADMVYRQREERRFAERGLVPLEVRVLALEARAKHGSRDAQRALFTIRQSVERAERKLRQRERAWLDAA